jgi:hypothetical protein
MSAPATERPAQLRPLVYAEPAARLAAVEILPAGSVLEVEVAKLLVRGRQSRWTWYGKQVQRPWYVVRSDDGWSALVRRWGGRITKRRGVWLVRDVFPTKSERP